MDKNNFQKVNIKDISIDPKNPYGKGFDCTRLFKFVIPDHLSKEDKEKCQEMIGFLTAYENDNKEEINQYMENAVKKSIETILIWGGYTQTTTTVDDEKDLIKEISKKYSLMESTDEDLPEPPKIWEKKNKRYIKRKGWK